MPGRKMLALLLVLASCALAAAPAWVDLEKRLTPEQLHATGLDTLSPAQLALLNRLLREDAAAAPAASSATGTATPPPPQPAPMHIGLEEGPVHSRLVGTLSGWEPGTEFVLANGQK